MSPLIRDGHLECLGAAGGGALRAAPLPASASSAGSREQPIDPPGSVQTPLPAKRLGDRVSCFHSVFLTNDAFMLFHVVSVNLGRVESV